MAALALGLALCGCRGLDPIGDTERASSITSIMASQVVAEGSIRLGILKVPNGLTKGGRECGCRGLDPIGDTESSFP